MINNPALEHMAVNDLNQRYGDSYVRYNEKIAYCFEIGRNEFTKEMTWRFVNTYDGNDEVGIFDWKLLDVSRPKSGWYPNGDPTKRSAVWFATTNDRQWARGLQGRNYTLYHASFESKNTINKYEFFQQIWKGPDPIKIRINQTDLLLKIQVYPSVILQPNLALGKENGTPVFYWRKNPIAKVVKPNIITVTNENFIEELRESIPDLRMEIGEPEKKIVEYQAYANDDFNVVADAVAALRRMNPPAPPPEPPRLRRQFPPQFPPPAQWGWDVGVQVMPPDDQDMINEILGPNQR